MWESFCGDEEWRYESVRAQHFSGRVLKLCVLFSCGRSGLLTGNTGLIVEVIVGTLCLWASSPSSARYVGDGGMWVMSFVSFFAEHQRKVKMQKCQSPPARFLCARCSVASPSCSSSSRQELRGRWLGGRRPLLVLIQRSLAVREEDGEHGFIPTSCLRLQRQVCRSELTKTDMFWTDLNVRTAHMTFCTPEWEKSHVFKVKVNLCSHLVPVLSSAGRDGSVAGAVDEEDFIQAFEDVPTVQVRSLLYPTFQHELVLLIMFRSLLFLSTRSTPTGR